MSRVKVPNITYTYLNTPDSPKRLKRAYHRIFTIAVRQLTADQWEAVERIKLELDFRAANRVH